MRNKHAFWKKPPFWVKEEKIILLENMTKVSDIYLHHDSSTHNIKE